MLPSPEQVSARLAADNPGLDTSPMELMALLKRIEALHSQAIEPLYETAALTPAEVDILIPLRYASEPVIARSLASHIRISRAGIGKALARLEKRGYIQREAHPADRRAALVTITQAGREALDAIFPKQLTVEAEILASLGDDREAALHALKRLVAVLEAGVRPPLG